MHYILYIYFPVFHYFVYNKNEVEIMDRFFYFFALCPNQQLRSLRDGHTFPGQALNQYFCAHAFATLLECFSGREENDHINYFTINLHEI